MNSTTLINTIVNRAHLSILIAFASLAAIAGAGPLQAVYTLENVWLQPEGWGSAQPMTGSFVWTYQQGDFENGSGEFTSLDIPWSSFGQDDLEIVFDSTSIEFVLPGNWHDLGVDITLHLLQPLAPNQVSVIDTNRSHFEIQQGVSYRGTVISGAVMPESILELTLSGTCPSDVTATINNATPNGVVALLYAFDTGTIVLPVTSCGGTTLGLGDSAALARALVADENGTATLTTSVPAGACGNVYLQAIDLTSCETSPAQLLE